MAGVLAIDGGGTKTILATASRDGVIDTWLEGPGINPVDNPDWLASFEAQIQAAGAAARTCDHAVLALPAYGEIAAVTQSQNQAAASALGQSHAILNDVEAAHVAAFAGGPGVLILAGTGSMAWARDEHGNSLRVGGWGDAFGDEGSAFWIGREAIARLSRALDGRLVAPALVEALFAFLGLDRADPPQALLQWHVELSHPRSQIAALSVLVDRLAEAGEEVAVAILAEAAEHLARHVEAAWRRMKATQCLPWSHAGGVFASKRVMTQLTARLGCPPLPPHLPPIGGALLRAAQDLDWPVDQAWIERLRASIIEHASRARNGRT
ncbi:N-acetylglucosamine kinase [Labrys sp. KNU-23]|uniref:N-acetylglucosamine kinase n=1 Tax=Labrys sp. KNU-23 TaxID=2789216 RepID=UPI0011F03DBD|nr:BadF/BadG/BcrA/BcrD ATPase family protein [Labrys sp. KNU-23]QEN85806.1 N-acetylglucosamine kinase [Labrys sp. KNU-23]